MRILDGGSNITFKTVMAKGNEYAVMNNGLICRIDENKHLCKPLKVLETRYDCSVQLGTSNRKYIADIVAACYVPNTQGHSTIGFKDGNFKNYHKDNLVWGTSTRVQYADGTYRHAVFAVCRFDKPIAYFTNADAAIDKVLGTRSVEDILHIGYNSLVRHVADGKFTALPDDYDIKLIRYVSDEYVLCETSEAPAKVCPECHTLKSLLDYSLTLEERLKPRCKECCAAATRESKRKRADKVYARAWDTLREED